MNYQRRPPKTGEVRISGTERVVEFDVAPHWYLFDDELWEHINERCLLYLDSYEEDELDAAAVAGALEVLRTRLGSDFEERGYEWRIDGRIERKVVSAEDAAALYRRMIDLFEQAVESRAVVEVRL